LRKKNLYVGFFPSVYVMWIHSFFFLSIANVSPRVEYIQKKKYKVIYDTMRKERIVDLEHGRNVFLFNVDLGFFSRIFVTEHAYITHLYVVE
jgi:hypothetical protein